MSLAVKVLRHLPVKLLLPVLKVLFKKNGLVLEAVRRVHSFYLFKVNGYYLPSESLNWFISYQYFQDKCRRISLYAYVPQPGDTIVDIGAGIGEEVIYFSELVGEEGHVYAIEANPEVFDVLRSVVELNGLKNVSLFNLAVAEKSGPFELSLGSDSFLSATISKGSTSSRRFVVKGVNLYHWFAETGINQVDLLKVNIEGAERFLVPQNGNQLDPVQNVAISCHDFRFAEEGNEFFRTKDVVIGFLKNHSFEVKGQNTSFAYINDWVYGHRVTN